MLRSSTHGFCRHPKTLSERRLSRCNPSCCTCARGSKSVADLCPRRIRQTGTDLEEAVSFCMRHNGRRGFLRDSQNGMVELALGFPERQPSTHLVQTCLGQPPYPLENLLQLPYLQPCLVQNLSRSSTNLLQSGARQCLCLLRVLPTRTMKMFKAFMVPASW